MVTSRSQAQALIASGKVQSKGRLLMKPALLVEPDIELVVERPRFVSRAGEKLASVAHVLGLNFLDKSVLDVGASTGGFTDFALQQGAARVFCVDVGTNQLAHSLRSNERVIAMEQTDIRVTRLPEQVDMIVMDVSFVSVTKLLEAAATHLKPHGELVVMVKPQFEGGKALADVYRGVIPLGPVRDNVVAEVRVWLTERFTILNEVDSGIAGAEGNVERFFYLKS